MKNKYQRPEIEIVNFEITNNLMTGNDGAEIPGVGGVTGSNEGVDWD